MAGIIATVESPSLDHALKTAIAAHQAEGPARRAWLLGWDYYCAESDA